MQQCETWLRDVAFEVSHAPSIKDSTFSGRSPSVENRKGTSIAIVLGCVAMAASPTWITDLESVLQPSEIVQPGSQLYGEETKTWAAQRNLKPNVLVRPESAQQLARVLAYLHDTELDFAVRSGGVGSSSAKDVLVSLAAFDA